jgi:glycolate oxidase
MGTYLPHQDLPPRVSHAAVARVTRALARDLPAGRLRDDPEVLARYATDESGADGFAADLVVLPECTEEVARVLEAASREGVPVTPRGAGTGRAGGAVPVAGGIVLCLERMARILEIDAASQTVRVQPGVITGELQAAVEAEGLFYPPDPNSLESCHIGGNVATNAGGPRAAKYGVTREYVLGVEAVLAGGAVLRPGKRSLKGVAGYDLCGLLVGSEGTLAVLTEITLRLRPKAPRVETALCFFPDPARAGRAVLAIARAGIAPRALELMDAAAIDAVRGRAAFPFPEGESAALLLELDGRGDEVFEALVAAGEIAEAAGAREVIVAQSQSQRAALWQARRQLSPALREAHRYKVAEDIAVPLARIPECIERFHAIADRHHLACAIYGHAGDGNLHANLLWDDASLEPEVAAAVEALFRLAVELGGTITGEHGVGLVKRPYLSLEQSHALIEVQRRLKAALDPAGILNPGKVLPGVGR